MRIGASKSDKAIFPLAAGDWRHTAPLGINSERCEAL